jgi:arylsulfatase A-like enzyme
MGAFEACTLLLVSDHGMARVERWVDLSGRLREQGIEARVLGGGGFAILSVEDGQEDAAARVARELGLEAWVRAQAPETMRLGNPRYGDVVVIAPVGTALGRAPSRLGRLAARLLGRTSFLAGAHGHRPEAPEMDALFVAAGRGVPSGARKDLVHSVDVAPTVLRLLGVRPPEWMEGRPIEGLDFPQLTGEEAP